MGVEVSSFASFGQQTAASSFVSLGRMQRRRDAAVAQRRRGGG